MSEKQVLPPQALQSMQSGFGSSIRTPVSFTTGKFVFQIDAYEQTTAAQILARGPQSGAERLAIYNEQYWYRLFTILQEEFPVLANYLGFWGFNQLASRYLDCRPSKSPFLENLSLNFEAWLQIDETKKSPILEQIVRLETIFLEAFNVPDSSLLQSEQFADAVPSLSEESILKFQVGFALYEEDWNIMACRSQFLQGPSQSSESKETSSGSIPYKIQPIEKKGHWAIYKKNSQIHWIEQDPVAYQLLVHLKMGKPIGEACGEVAETLEEAELEPLVTNLPTWFAAWTAMGWFAN